MPKLTLDETAKRLGNEGTLRDQLGRAARAVGRFKDAQSADDRTDAMIEAARLLWDLGEWAFRLHEVATGVSLGEFRAAVEARCPALTPMCDLRNAVAHRELDQAKALDEMRVSASPLVLDAGVVTYMSGTRGVPYQRPPYEDRVAVHKWVIGGREQAVTPHLEEALAFWSAYAGNKEPL